MHTTNQLNTFGTRIASSPSIDDASAHLNGKRVKKRIIVCCITTTDRLSYTNVLRLARTIEHEDFRTDPPTPQIVFYQSGIGSADNFYSEYVEGTTGDTLGDKVEEAYAFIAHNYFPGDEIFLFGFSRGAYTARMVAMFIGAIGVLNRKDMDSFAGIFITYQNLGKCDDEQEKQKLNAQLAPWNNPNCAGIRRAYADDRSFSVKCVGVFETVGTMGLPEELTLQSPKLKRLFGFPDRLLGPHIECAYQALALNETSTDVGGGYKHHDLADISLTWMVAHVGNILATDPRYLATLPDPIAPWGAQKPHDPKTGVFALSFTTLRTLPTKTDDVTHEKIHPSVLQQTNLSPRVKQDLKDHPELIGELLPLEEEMKAGWLYNPAHAAEELKKNPESSPVGGPPPGPHLSHERHPLAGFAHNVVQAASSIIQTVAKEV
ncbi:hypothetical protein BDP27DRAFT_1380318 [Rhodocollybia butyracea]|uniref:T6SS Phospholipase effector Tle1-like catalytic domain-containing protein n=1 Tax=Rhodocollybia butyracea TaxID=206335 RepID=A0A9P5Q7T3_9AGAR|nr:hypothetical protein BDP27DRAFT_1380318 [Rhodocollybia butyracea]